MNVSSRLSSANSPSRSPLPTVRVIRWPDGSSTLTRILNAHPWVLRKPWLVPEDVD